MDWPLLVSGFGRTLAGGHGACATAKFDLFVKMRVGQGILVLYDVDLHPAVLAATGPAGVVCDWSGLLGLTRGLNLRDDSLVRDRKRVLNGMRVSMR
jgi:hypothetical protein